MRRQPIADRNIPKEGPPLARRAPSAPASSRRPALNKHQQRTDETQRKLLKAAEKVFAKVGFEAARLEDIAKEAGHTRGAFYAHFSKKEDIFFALLEQQAQQRLKDTQAITEKCGDDVKRRLLCIQDYYSSLAANRHWAMLMLEFKLFAVRHAHLKKKLAARHREIRSSFRKDSGHWIEKASVPPNSVALPKIKIALEAMLYGLILESDYDPVMLPKSEVTPLLREVFDLLTGASRGTRV